MVNTVSAEAVGAAGTVAPASDARPTEAGTVASDIQSSGITKRAKTFPLRPVPRSPEADRSDFLSPGFRLSPATLLVATAGLMSESAWVETAFELARLARTKTWAWPGVGAIPVRTARI